MAKSSIGADYSHVANNSSAILREAVKYRKACRELQEVGAMMHTPDQIKLYKRRLRAWGKANQVFLEVVTGADIEQKWR